MKETIDTYSYNTDMNRTEIVKTRYGLHYTVSVCVCLCVCVCVCVREREKKEKERERDSKGAGMRKLLFSLFFLHT